MARRSFRRGGTGYVAPESGTRSGGSGGAKSADVPREGRAAYMGYVPPESGKTHAEGSGSSVELAQRTAEAYRTEGNISAAEKIEAVISPTTEYVATEYFRPSAIRPAEPRVETVTTREAIRQPTITPEVTWKEKAGAFLGTVMFTPKIIKEKVTKTGAALITKPPIQIIKEKVMGYLRPEAEQELEKIIPKVEDQQKKLQDEYAQFQRDLENIKFESYRTPLSEIKKMYPNYKFIVEGEEIKISYPKLEARQKQLNKEVYEVEKRIRKLEEGVVEEKKGFMAGWEKAAEKPPLEPTTPKERERGKALLRGASWLIPTEGILARAKGLPKDFTYEIKGIPTPIPKPTKVKEKALEVGKFIKERPIEFGITAAGAVVGGYLAGRALTTLQPKTTVQLQPLGKAVIVDTKTTITGKRISVRGVAQQKFRETIFYGEKKFAVRTFLEKQPFKIKGVQKPLGGIDITMARLKDLSDYQSYALRMPGAEKPLQLGGREIKQFVKTFKRYYDVSTGTYKQIPTVGYELKGWTIPKTPTSPKMFLQIKGRGLVTTVAKQEPVLVTPKEVKIPLLKGTQLQFFVTKTEMVVARPYLTGKLFKTVKWEYVAPKPVYTTGFGYAGERFKLAIGEPSKVIFEQYTGFGLGRMVGKAAPKYVKQFDISRVFKETEIKTLRKAPSITVLDKYGKPLKIYPFLTGRTRVEVITPLAEKEFMTSPLLGISPITPSIPQVPKPSGLLLVPPRLGVEEREKVSVVSKQSSMLLQLQKPLTRQEEKGLLGLKPVSKLVSKPAMRMKTGVGMVQAPFSLERAAQAQQQRVQQVQKAALQLKTIGVSVRVGVVTPRPSISTPRGFWPWVQFPGLVKKFPKPVKFEMPKEFRPLGYVPQPAAVILGITAEKVPAPEFGKFGYSPLQLRPIIVPKPIKKKKKKVRRKRR